jgi:hypothetical protein
VEAVCNNTWTANLTDDTRVCFFFFFFLGPAGRKVGVPHRARVPHGTALTRGFKECLKTDRVTLPGHPLLSNNIGGKNSNIVNDSH